MCWGSLRGPFAHHLKPESRPSTTTRYGVSRSHNSIALTSRQRAKQLDFLLARVHLRPSASLGQPWGLIACDTSSLRSLRPRGLQVGFCFRVHTRCCIELEAVYKPRTALHRLRLLRSPLAFLQRLSRACRVAVLIVEAIPQACFDDSGHSAA